MTTTNGWVGSSSPSEWYASIRRSQPFGPLASISSDALSTHLGSVASENDDGGIDLLGLLAGEVSDVLASDFVCFDRRLVGNLSGKASGRGKETTSINDI